MNSLPPVPQMAERPARARLWPLGLVATVLGVLFAVSIAADWYARQVSLPRYCEAPEIALGRLAWMHAGSGPSVNESRRDYMVAAKLEFLVPRAQGESPQAYRERVRRELEKQCKLRGFLGRNSLFIGLV